MPNAEPTPEELAAFLHEPPCPRCCAPLGSMASILEEEFAGPRDPDFAGRRLAYLVVACLSCGAPIQFSDTTEGPTWLTGEDLRTLPPDALRRLHRAVLDIVTERPTRVRCIAPECQHGDAAST